MVYNGILMETIVISVVVSIGLLLGLFLAGKTTCDLFSTHVTNDFFLLCVIARFTLGLCD